MVSEDTIKLLDECDAGTIMGVSSIKSVLDYVKSSELSEMLDKCMKEHERLRNEIEERLCELGDGGKKPSPIAKGMSWIKTNVKLAANESDSTIADLVTDGCNMGVKSLNKYLNKYKAADELSKDFAKRLINLEEELAVNIRGFL